MHLLAIGSALAADLSLRRSDMKMVCVYSPQTISAHTKRHGLNPLNISTINTHVDLKNELNSDEPSTDPTSLWIPRRDAWERSNSLTSPVTSPLDSSPNDAHIILQRSSSFTQYWPQQSPNASHGSEATGAGAKRKIHHVSFDRPMFRQQQQQQQQQQVSHQTDQVSLFTAATKDAVRSPTSTLSRILCVFR